ncbi:MAG: 2-amino-4-hydroxy-6-hydroxymethyldihydropteridine diphosphokinase [Gemmatimonadales bacterium]
MPEPGSDVYVGLGSNLGEREEHLRRAVLALRDAITIERVSSIWLTEPVGLREQPPFYNAVVGGRTTLAPRALLHALLAVERGLGRVREAEPVENGPRTIDLDLLLHGDRVLDERGLVLPHPRMTARRFVLAPLAEIAPDLRIGDHPRTVVEMLAALAPGQNAVERLALPGWPPEVIRPLR